jgi:Arc/MetJ-type ribon-helix-helix transcriptional regulator
MPTTTRLSARLLELPTRDRAALAVELIDSLGETAWDDTELTALAEERDAELESGTVKALSHEEFMAGLRRPSQPR